MTPMANDPNPPDYMGLGKRMDAAGRLMKDASELIESEEDMKAASRQVEALELLEGVQQELQTQMKNQLGDELERLREALANVEGLREELRAELTRVETSDGTGKPAPGKPTSATQGPGGGPSGSSGVGGLRKDGPVEDWVDGSVRADGPAMAPMRSWDPRSMTVRLGTIQYLLEPNSPAAPLIEGLLEMVASDMWAAPEAPEGSIEYIGEFSTMLDKLEEIMAIELAGGDQLQRLNQSGVEDLPPRFREMASDYFESLATQARESNSSGN
jgi:hypothetical protein